MTVCPTCKGQRWVCENHPDKPWETEDGCGCGAGMPCLECNQVPEGVWPAPIPGCVTIWSIWSDGETIQ
jgi:hypothetical protein